MKKALTTEEWIAKRRAKAAERNKKIKPAREYRSAGVTAHRKFTKIRSQATYGAGYSDPKGYKEYFAPDLAASELGR